MFQTSEKELSSELAQSILILDTCFLLDDDFPLFLRYFRLVLEKNPPILLDRVAGEVERLATADSRDEIATRPGMVPKTKEEIAQTAVAARRARTALERLKRSGGVRIVETLCRAHGDAAILEYSMEERIHHAICILTNERNLTSDLYDLTRQKSVDSEYSLNVAGFRNGKFGIWEDPAHGQAGWFRAFINIRSVADSEASQAVASRPIRETSSTTREKSRSETARDSRSDSGFRRFSSFYHASSRGSSIVKPPRISRREKWFGISCIVAMLALPALFTLWLGLDRWISTAFWGSLVLTLFFLHYGTFLMVVLVPLLISWLIERFLGVPIHWTLPTLMLFGSWYCFRCADEFGELLHPGGRKCVLGILWRLFVH